jgi:hypothetical protein
MRLYDTIICCVCVVFAGCLFVVSARQLDYINKQRQELHLVIDKPENLPPSLAFATIATGAFRGLVVDYLFMRADTLKEQKQFFDAKQLAEWIAILQPRFAAVWEFLAWNMSYNISVAIPASQYEQRWRWVKNGYELLRDQAITKYNLKNIEIYRELSMIFQHKIGGMSDDDHKYYKLQLAMEMEPLLGSADNKYFDALADAPRQWQDITNEPEASGLIKALKQASPIFSSENEFIKNYFELLADPNSPQWQTAGAVLRQYQNTPAALKLHVFACAWKLRNVWKLEPKLMREINKTYGPIDFNDPNTHLPLDWRHPDSHAIYWAVRGLQVEKQTKAAKEQTGDSEIKIGMTNTDRMVGHSLQNLFRYGRIFIYEIIRDINDPVLGKGKQVFQDLFLRPDLRMFEPYNKSLLATLEKYHNKANEGAYQSLQDGHRNMLKNAVFSFYQSGLRNQAQKIFNELKKLYPRPEFDVPLVTFARNRLLEELQDGENPLDTREQLEAMLLEAYYLYAIGDDDESFGREQMAEEIYNYFQMDNRNDPGRVLPDFNVIRTLAMRDFLNQPLYPDYVRKSLLARMSSERPDLYKKLIAEQEKYLLESNKSQQPKSP